MVTGNYQTETVLDELELRREPDGAETPMKVYRRVVEYGVCLELAPLAPWINQVVKARREALKEATPGDAGDK